MFRVWWPGWDHESRRENLIKNQASRPDRQILVDHVDHVKSRVDYVIRRFNASSAGLKKPLRLDLR